MRLVDWQVRFSDFAKERTALPFVWGSNDCCLFAADAVLAMTGTDPAADLRGYGSPLDAARVVREQGGLRAIATAALGPEVAPAFAGVGDVLLLENDGRELLAICNGANAIGPGPDGMAVLGMETALAAWKI